ncbi:hypothetical protein [Demequina silvatica]|uniref:hypothetical protein n=1 Tax=Demequina silvatica TaxID=1638988 RepID=UPI0007866AA4|nr:hypothetical protein [Demequina silvatica]
MMASIYDNGDGSFIAGDPPTSLQAGEHWCPECGGEGVEPSMQLDRDLDICGGCHGACVIDCPDGGCEECVPQRT